MKNKAEKTNTIQICIVKWIYYPNCPIPFGHKLILTTIKKLNEKLNLKEKNL